MKLILRYNWNIPWTASGTEIIPFEYSSKEDAFVDFFELKEKAEHEFTFAGQRWFTNEDLENDVQFFELNEWFQLYKA